jgi:hypothetical protein
LKSSSLRRLSILTLVIGTLAAIGAIGFLVKERGRVTIPTAVLGSAAMVILELTRRYLFPKVKAAIAQEQMKKP